MLSRVASSCFLSGVLLVSLGLAAQPAPAPQVEPNSAVLELDIPPGSRVKLGSKEYGAGKKFTFKPFEQGRWMRFPLSVATPDGEFRRRIFLKSGWHVLLPLQRRLADHVGVILQRDHTDLIFAAVFSPDGRYLATASGDGLAALWDARTGQKLRLYRPDSRSCDSLAFNSTGTQLLVGGGDGSATLFEVASGKKVLRLSGHDSEGHDPNVRAVAISPDGERLLTASWDHTAILWDSAGRKLHHLKGHNDRIYKAQFSPDGQWLITISDDGYALLWQTKTGNRVRTLTREAGSASVAFSPDSQSVVLLKGNQTAELFRVASGVQVQTFRGHTDRLESVVFHPEGKLLATAAYNGECWLWDIATGQPKWRRAIPAGPGPMFFSKDGRLLITTDGAGGVTVLRAATGEKIRSLLRHFDQVYDLALTPDGQRLLTHARDYSAILWDLNLGEPIRMIGRRTDGAWVTAQSRDGQRVMVASEQAVEVWDVPNGRRLRSFPASTGAPAFSPLGGLVVTGTPDHTIQVWSVKSGTVKRTLTGHTYALNMSEFSRDGQFLLTCSYNRETFLWDLQSGKKLHAFVGTRAGFSPDGRWVLAGVRRSFTLYDARTGKAHATFEGHGAAFSPDGKKLATLSLKGGILLWDLATARQVDQIGKEGVVLEFIDFHPDNQHVVTAGPKNDVTLWDTSPQHKHRSLAGHQSNVLVVHCSPDGKYIISGGEDATAHLWEVETGKSLQSWSLKDRVNLVEFSRDSSSLLIGCLGSTVWSIAVPTLKYNLWFERRDRLVNVRFSPDGQTLLTCTSDRLMALWQVRTGMQTAVYPGLGGISQKHLLYNDGTTARLHLVQLSSNREVSTFEGHNEYLNHVEFSPDGQRAVTAASDGKAILWDVAKGVPLAVLKKHSDGVARAAFSRDGQLLATASWDKTVQLYNGQTGQHQKALTGHTGAVNGLSFSPDGTLLATAGSDRCVIIWDLKKGTQRFNLNQHEEAVLDLCFGPDGRYLLSVTAATLQIFDPQNGDMVRQIPTHDLITSADFSPDGRYILLGHNDGTCTLRDLASADLLAGLVSLNAGKDWLVYTPQGLFDGSAGGREQVSFRIGEGLTVAPADRFFDDFYRPGLLAALLRGERPVPAEKLGGNQPPLIRVVTLPHEEATEARVKLEVDVTDQGGGIKGPWLVHNGARLLDQGAVGESVKIGVVRRTFLVDLVAGENRLEVHAATNRGPSWESEPLRLKVRYTRAPEKGALFVLAIGVNQYEKPITALRYAARGAKTLAELFGKRGAGLYTRVQPLVLSDEKASRAGIRTALQQIARQARPQDTLVLYFAGHGTLVEGRYHFLAHDFHPKKNESLTAAVKTGALSEDELGTLIAATAARQRLLILDTCHAGGALGVASATAGDNDARGTAERLSRAQGVFTITASGATAEAFEVEALGHGVLTYTLLAALNAVDGGPLQKKGISDGDPTRPVTVLEWFNYASEQVPALTRQFARREQEVYMAVQGRRLQVLPAGP